MIGRLRTRISVASVLEILFTGNPAIRWEYLTYPAFLRRTAWNDVHSPELHAAYVTREQLVGRQAGPVVLFAVFEIGRTVTVTLAALVALERFLVAAVAAVAAHRLSGVLQGRVLFQQPRGRETRQAYGTPDQAPAGHLVAGAHAWADQPLLLEHRVQRHGRFCVHTQTQYNLYAIIVSSCYQSQYVNAKKEFEGGTGAIWRELRFFGRRHRLFWR